MSDIKSFIGREAPITPYHATEEKLKAFCAAVGAKYRGEAPPTFMAVLLPGMFKLLDEIGIPLSAVLHTDQEYCYKQPILPNDRLTYVTKLVKALEKQSKTGSMKFMVFETSVTASRAGGSDIEVGACKTTIITRD
ncbi:MAG: MaoC family dehydratase N-terminal domain-containing protein [Oligoflexia bacterium]|nr:MaoC family dehydratase N-terminal domain-containing protein [Oligoflexia bacterium]